MGGAASDRSSIDELDETKDRLAISAVLTVGVSSFAIADIVGLPLSTMLPRVGRDWIELALATPVILWGGFPLFVRAISALRRRRPDLFSLVGLGAAAAYGYSLVALFVSVLFPSTFPSIFPGQGGAPTTYFEVATALIASTLLVRWLQLRSRAHSARLD